MLTKTTIIKTFLATLLLFILPGIKQAYAQTPGLDDLAFTGYNSNDGSGGATMNQVTLVILRSGGLPSGTVFHITDNGYSTVSPAGLTTTEGDITITLSAALPQFTTIYVNAGTAGTGPVTVTQNSSGSFSSTGISASISGTFQLSIAGDQVFAFTGSLASPSYITGLHMNSEVAGGAGQPATTQAHWDFVDASNTSTGWAMNSTRSAKPPGLSTSTTALIGVVSPGTASAERDNGQFNCAQSSAGSLAALQAKLGDVANWNLQDITPYTITTSCSFSLGSAAAITGQPSNATVCDGASTSFTATASNVTGFTWEYSTNGGSSYNTLTISGVYSVSSTTGTSGSSTLTISNTSGLNGYMYRAIAAGSAGNATSNAATLTVNTSPSITSQPSNVSICAGSSTSFTSAANNATTYQWQVNTGSGFTNITNGGVYSGATTTTLSITGATTAMNGYQYQLIATGSCTPATSNAVTLSVSGTDTWSGGTSTAWSTATNWSCGSIPTASTDVLIPSGTSFSPQVDITSAICNNITINTGASLSFVAGSNVLEVKGNFTKNGTLVATAGKLKLSGTGAQTVPGATYKDFELAGSGTKTANGGINISGVLTLTNGFLQLGANDLTLGSAASVAGANAVLLNAAPTSYIITNSTGQMRIQNIGATGKTGAVLFPVGTSSSSYTPVTIQNAGTSDVFGVRVIDGVYRSYTAAGVPNGTLQSNYNVNKTWLITESTAGGSNATVNFAWALSDQQPSFDNGACFASHFTNGNWQTVFPGQTANGFDPYSLAMNNITSFSPFAIGSSGSILPLDLLSFTGKAAPNGAQLNWNTINEKNLAGFDVERSADGNTYERITTVAAKGNNSTMENSYTYTDATTSKGTSYYRLKINDYGTEFKYSNTVVISENGTKNYAYTVYPNPADGNDLNIRFSDVLTSGVDVTITDVTGRVWYKGNFEAGKSILPVNIKGIPAGIYQVHISSDMISGTTRFTKL